MFKLLPFEVLLKPNHLFEKLFGLVLDVILDELELRFVFGGQLVRINILNEYLALLQASTYLIRQPGSDRGSTGSSRVLDVVNDIFFHHSPVLMSKFESSMNVLQH